MKPFILSLLWLFILVIGQNSHAESTQEMLSHCKSMAENTGVIAGDEILIKPNNFQSGQCWGSFAVIQNLIMVVYYDGKKPVYEGNKPFYGVCVPPESTRLQLINIFVAYAKNKPKIHHQDFLSTAFESLRDSFPCEN